MTKHILDRVQKRLAGNDKVREKLKEQRPRRGKAAAAEAPANPPPGDDARPVIKVIGGTLPEQIAQAEAALIDAKVELYQRNGELVRPIRLSREEDEKGVCIQAGSMVLGGADKFWLAKTMTQMARFEKRDHRANQWRATDCPPKVAETYMSMAGEWLVPPIVGIAESPTMRHDGSLILESGYDRRSGIFVDYQGQPVNVIDNPTREDALAALDVLKLPLAEFPFAEEIDRSVALSAILTTIIRRSLPTAPAHGKDAPKAGSGKGLLADIPALIATGRTATMISQGRDEAEDEKRLSTMLMRGSPVLCIDNVERPVCGDFLCTMLTQSVVSPRILGFNRAVDLPTSAMVLITGNNLQFAGDMTRRVLLCRIDPQCERPDARQFAVNLREWIPANRHRLIGAALTILRAYHVAGRPKQDIPQFGSFEAWSGLVRSALVWLGQPDPCETRARIEAADPVSTELAAVLALWHRAFGVSGKTTAEVVEACNLSVNADLKHALLEASASPRNPEAIDSKRLGKWLKKYERRVQDGLRIEKSGEDTHTKVVFWRVGKVAGSAGSAGSVSNPTRESVSDTDMTKIQDGWEMNPALPANPASSIAADREVL